MRRLMWVALVASLALAGQAMALQAPVVTNPTEGAALAPNYNVDGRMPYRAFIVVMTDVLTCEGDIMLRSVPGIRHWTQPDGSFHFRVASPRVSFGEKSTEVKYRVRVFEASAAGNGPETIINCACIAPPSNWIPTGFEESTMVAPTVDVPTEGAALGPNYDVKGRMPYKAFLVVLTDVITADGEQVLRTVPGIRHWTNANGTFHFRVASPRISIGEKEQKVKFRVRVFQATPDGNGPETVIHCTATY